MFSFISQYLGGWLGIGNITMMDPSLVATYWTNYIDTQAPSSQLQNIQDGKFMLDEQVVKRLFTDYGYTEVRLKCFKQWHGRTLHVILSGEKMVKYMKKEGLPGTGACKDINFLEDDTSLMGQSDCSSLEIGLSGDPYHYHLIWKAQAYHVMLTSSRFECDDDATNAGYTHAGSWLFFVR